MRLIAWIQECLHRVGTGRAAADVAHDDADGGCIRTAERADGQIAAERA